MPVCGPPMVAPPMELSDGEAVTVQLSRRSACFLTVRTGPALPLEVGKLALAAVVPQVQGVTEDPFSFPLNAQNCSLAGSRSSRSDLRVHPGAP